MKILIAGEGGQGVQTIGEILAKAAQLQGINSTYIPNFGVEQRGGVSLAFVIIQKSKIGFPKFKTADFLCIAAARAIPRIQQYLGQKTQILNTIEISKILKDNDIPVKSGNIFILGLMAQKIVKLETNKIKIAMNEKLAKSKNLDQNIKAFEIGLKYQFESPKLNESPPQEPIISSDDKKTYIQFPDYCKGCGLCIEKCPQDALSWSSQNVGLYKTPMPKVDIEKCTACRVCEKLCPDFAIRINKK